MRCLNGGRFFQFLLGVSAHLLLITLLNPLIISAEETYVFERMWPTLQQPWYFRDPHGVAVDDEGFVYIVEQNNHRIQKFASDGQFITKWGRWGSENGEFNFPTGIAVDKEGNIYVSDTIQDVDVFNYGANIQKFTSTGEFLAKWGGKGTEDGQFKCKYTEGIWIAIGPEGYVYVSDPHNHRIQKFTAGGQFVTKWGSYGSGQGQFDLPAGVVVDGDGYVYVVDSGNDRIQKFNSNGQFLLSWSHIGLKSNDCITVDKDNNVYAMKGYINCKISKFSSSGDLMSEWSFDGIEARGVAFDKEGYIYITDSSAIIIDLVEIAANHIQKFTADGNLITRWSSSGIVEGTFYDPVDIVVHPNGIVYVSDSRNHRIQMFDLDGQFLGQWGTNGLGDGEFNCPSSIAFDSSGNVYVTEGCGNNRVQKFLPDGTFLLKWGSSGTTDGQFETPSGIAVDSNDFIYVADSENDRVQKFTSEGIHIATWGETGEGDGQFHLPIAIAIDSNDDIYVVDRNNFRIQKFNKDGQFLTILPIYCGEISIDNEGYIYITYLNYQDGIRKDGVQKYTSDGQLVNEFGEFGEGSGDFNRPKGLSVSSNGNLYVVDGGNNRIQVFRKVAQIDRTKAIIVAGGGPFSGNNLWDATQMCASFAYRTLTYQGFTKETIYYLTSDLDLDLDANGELDDVDAEVTNNNIQQAITQWAADADNLFVYLVDHGGNGTFRLSGSEVLTALDLDNWLDQLQAILPGNVIVVYDACESGSFISQMTPPEGKERIVIGSTSPGESAYFITQGAISFSAFFWTHIFNGLNVKEAFDLAKASISNAIDYQHPLLDDNGNGIGNDQDDGALAQNTFIGNGTTIYGDVPIIGSISPAQTINDISSALLYAESITDNDGIARVWAVIRPPNYIQGTTYNPVNELPSIDLMPVGNDRWEGMWNNFNIHGTYHIAIYCRDRIGNTSVPVITTVSVNNPLTRKAIIVAAGWQADKLWPAIEKNARIAYNALRFQGYTEDDLYLMCNADIPDVVVDGPASVANLVDVLSNWAVSGTQDLILYMVVNGNHKSFRINQTESVSSVDIDGLLDNIQSIIPGEVTVIYDACRSGSFIEDLSPPEGKVRICIASTSSDKPANFNSDGTVSFSHFFWSAIANGADVYDAFVVGKNAMWYASDGEQTAYLDDNGNGLGNEKIDGAISRYFRLGSGIMLAGDEPLIGSVSPEQSLSGESSVVIWAQDVTTTGTIDKVWAVITPPNQGYSLPDEPVIDLPTVELIFNEGTSQWEGTYDNLSTAGTYSIAIYALDTNGNMSIPATTKITQTIGQDVYEDDDALTGSNIIELNTVKAQHHNFHDEGDADWIRFYGVAGESYEIKTEYAGSRCDTVIDLYDDKGNLIESRDDYIYAGGELLSWPCNKDGVYYVKITNYSAQDYGADTGYDLRVYHPVGGESGLVIGQVTNIYGDPVSGAIVKSDIGGCSAITLPNGYFLMDLPVGTHTITAETGGFGLLTQSSVEVGAENHFTLMFALTSTTIADLNGDGKADLADVILSLKILSGIDSTDSIRADFTGSSTDIGQNNTIGLEEAVYIMQSISDHR